MDTPKELQTVPTLPRSHASASSDELDEKKSGASTPTPDEEGARTVVAAAPDGATIVMPWRYKALALALCVFFPLGLRFTEATLGPLKSTLRRELGITNTQFGVINSAGSVVNAIWPIFTGVLLDWYGINWITVISTSTITAGAILSAVGTTVGNWRVLVGGRLIVGFGSVVIDSASHKLFYHYFGAGGLALAFGIDSTVSKLCSLVAGMTAVPISEETGSYSSVFWVPVGFSVTSMLIALFYIYFDTRILPKEYRMQPESQKANRKFSFKVLFQLPWAFWMLPMTQLLQSGAADGFSQSSADLIRMRGWSERTAGIISSSEDILPIVLFPLLGYVVDRWGHRFHYMSAAACMQITACAVIGFTNVHPILPVLIQSLGIMINAFPFQVTIPLLLRNQGYIGTAFGVWRCFNNSGGIITDLIFGVLQDGTEGMSYDRVLYFNMGFKAFAACLGLFYIFLDRRFFARGITMGEKERIAKEALVTDPEIDPLTARPTNKYVTWGGVSLMVSMVIVGWTLFFRYLID